MKLHKLFFGLLLLVFFSCSKEAPQVVPPDVKPDVEVKVDPDKEKYGKTISLGTQEFAIQSFRKESITEGLDYMKMIINEPKTEEQDGFKLLAHIVRLDRKTLTKDISVESLMGGPYLTSRETPINMAKAVSNAQKTVLAAVNADFFVMETGGTVLGAMVKNGTIIKTGNSDWKLTYGITKNNDFFIDELNYNITIDEDKYPINSINGPRSANHLVLYTTSKGTNTGANPWGSEIILKPVDGDWETLENHEKVVCEVVSNNPQGVAGGLAIAKGHIVLSGHGAGIAICNRYVKGQKVNISVSKPTGKTGKVYDVKEAVGAAYPILANGVVEEVTSTSGNPKGFEPRTAIGHSANFFYMVAIEGRSGVSQGVTVKQLGYLMKHFDATDAANLDGGGSTMLAIGNGIYGQPAGTSWFRPVPNGFSIVRKN